MALVDIVLPFYNRKDLLPRAVQSVINQEFTHWKLWLIDDGSDDDYLPAIAPFLKEDRIQLYKQKNLGVSVARNVGSSFGVGSYLAFLDSDDEWLPLKLTQQMKIMSMNDHKICQTREIWIRHGKRVNPPKHLIKKAGFIFKESLDHCMITPSSVLMTRELWNQYGPFDPELPACEDYDLWLKICAKEPVALIDQDLMIRYGGHEDQLSAKYPAMDQFRLYSLSNLIAIKTLSPEYQNLALEVFHKKLGILKKGALKHNNSSVLVLLESFNKKVSN
jgi:glycosyltransferase involved in cell wall biosynthesis